MTNETENTAVDLGRRRLAKGGLAVPVVLATLASKNALSAVPYQCMISGKISGNNSPNGPATTESCKLGKSGRTWLSELSDTAGTPGARKLANLYPAGMFSDVYDLKPSTSRIVAANTLSTTNRATVNQILRYGAGSPTPPYLGYGKKALVLYLNAEMLNGAMGTAHDFYPLTTTEAKDIFNAIVANTGYSGTTSLGPFTWTNTELRSYIDLLYF